MATEIGSQIISRTWPLRPQAAKLAVSLELEAFQRGIPAPTAFSALLPVRVKKLLDEFVHIVQDDKWAEMFSELIGTASIVCSIIGGDAAKEVPFLSFLTSPLNLYHAIQGAKQSFKLVAIAFKTSRVVDFFFFLAKGVSCVSSALSASIKPFTGTAAILALFGLIKLHVTFTLVIPIVLIALSILGSPSQMWTLSRSSKALHAYKLERETLNGSLQALERFLHRVKAPTPQGVDYAVEAKIWKDTHSTSEERGQLLEKRIQVLLGFGGGETLVHARETLEKLLPLVDQSALLFLQDFHKASTPLIQIEKTLALSEEMLRLLNDHQNPHLAESIKTLKEGVQKLHEMKSILLAEGGEITATLQSEIERRIAEQTLTLVSTVLTVISSIFFLSTAQYLDYAYALSIASSVFAISSVLLNKSVSKSYFQPTERFLELFPKNLDDETSVLDSD